MIKDHAQAYIKHGWSVIPLKPKSKVPLYNWTEFQTRMPTESEINQWPSDCDIGIVTGRVSGLAVIDLDGPEGLKSGSTLGLASPVVAVTGKGRHYFYRHAAIQNKVRLYPGLDIRSEGGFVKAAPSIHESGRRYSWLTPWTLPLPVFPNLPSVGPEPLDSRTASNSLGWIAEALSSLKHGNMDDTFTRLCGKMRREGFSAVDAFALLQPHIERAKQIWHKADESFLRSKIQHIWSSYEAKVVPVQAEIKSESVDEFLESDEKVEWLCDGLIAKNSIGFVVGLPETGKTWMLIDFAIECALGGTWLGKFKTKKSKVLFIDQERFKGETRRRFKAVINGKGLTKVCLRESLFIQCGTSTRLDLNTSYEAFRKELEKLRPDVVIVDSWTTFHTRDENNRQAIQEVIEKVKQLRQEFGCTFLFIHHSNKFAFQSKDEGKEPTVAEMAGSIALPAAAETVFMIRRMDPQTSLAFHVKSTLAQKIEPFSVKVEDVPSGIIVMGVTV